VLRLARFNVTQAGESKSYFIGLPSPAAGGTLATYYWFTQTPLYQQTQIIDLPWQEIMRYLMILLAFLMISPVPYPAWPKIGLRTWRGRGALLLILGMVIGATLYSKYFFFLFGVGYVIYGLARAVLLGLLERQEGREPRRRATDFAPLPDFPPPVGNDATAADRFDTDEFEVARFGSEFDADEIDSDPVDAAGAAAAPNGDDPAAAPRRRRKRRRARGDRPPQQPPTSRSEDPSA
jgi:CDP-diacylglycerol--serine O-phosphatidyltransferase